MTDRPKRIQRRRTKGWRMPPGTVAVSRPSKWGNPYIVGTKMVKLDGVNPNAPRDPLSAQEAVDLYRETWPYRAGRLDVSELRGKDLACWCPLLDENGNRFPCHADILLEISNA